MLAFKGISLLIIAIFGGNVLLSRFFKKRFEEVAPLTVFCYVIMLYCFGFVSRLDIAVLLILLIGFCGCGYCFYLWYIKKEKEFIKKDVFTFGLVAFLFIVAFVFVTSFDKGFSVWDEFSHWGPMVKQTFSSNAFHNAPGSLSFANKNYPPAVILFEYLLCKFSGAYAENSVLMAMQIFTFSMFLPAFSGFKKIKQLFIFVVSVLLVLVTPGLFGLNIFFATIYLDGALAILIAFSFYLFVSTEKPRAFEYLYIFIAVFIACLTKEMGMICVLALSVLIFFDAVIKFFKKNKAKEIMLENGSYLLCVWLAGAFAVFSWKLENLLFNSTGTFSGDALVNSSPFSLIKALFGAGNAEQFDIFFTFWRANFQASLAQVFPGLVDWTFFLTCVLLVCLTTVACLIAKNNKDKFLAFAISVPIILIMYNQVMLVMYLVENGYAAKYLQSYDRYMLTICLGVFAALVMLSAKYFSKPKDLLIENDSAWQDLRINWVVIATFIVIFCTPQMLVVDMLIPSQKSGSWQGGVGTIFTNQAAAAEMVTSELEGKETVLQFLCPNTPGNGSVAFRYYYMPKTMVGHFSIGRPTDKNDVWAAGQTPQAFSKSLEDLAVTHIYLSNSSPLFEEDFAIMFKNAKVIENSLYSVILEGEIASLELVRSLN